MIKYFSICVFLFCCTACAVTTTPAPPIEATPIGRGPYSVGSTNMAVAAEYADIGDDAMEMYLKGHATESGSFQYITDILKHPESAWTTDVRVPDEPALYGPASGMTLPVAIYLTYPSSTDQQPNSYTFPYHNGSYGIFENMLAAGEQPKFADPDKHYPLIVDSHGATGHGMYDVGRAHELASQGYIVAVISYGDNRTWTPGSGDLHVGFLRPLITKAVIDSVLASETFGPHIDTDNIGIAGYSLGGMTALALAGGPVLGESASVSDNRIKASVVAAPWVGGYIDGKEIFAFGPDNTGLANTTIPILCLFGTKDEAAMPLFILPAVKQLAGPTYVVELVDQPHVFEAGSWADRKNWESLFFSAYLKNDPASLKLLKAAHSMRGGNGDIQLFEYQ